MEDSQVVSISSLILMVFQKKVVRIILVKIQLVELARVLMFAEIVQVLLQEREIQTHSNHVRLSPITKNGKSMSMVTFQELIK